MKNLIIGLIALSSLTSFANCEKFYKAASIAKNQKKKAAIDETLNVIGGGVLKNILKVKNENDLDNQFKQTLTSNKTLQRQHLIDENYGKIIEKSLRQSSREATSYNIELAAEILIEGFENGDFCPVLDTNKWGTETRTVLTNKQISKYLANKLKEK